MQIALTWDDAPADDPDSGTIVRWDFSGGIGLIDYIKPINETARMAIFAGGDIAAILNLGWQMPFPNRPFKYLAQAIMAAPPGLKTMVIACPNPLSRWIITARLLHPHPALTGRLHIARSLAAARAQLAAQRTE